MASAGGRLGVPPPEATSATAAMHTAMAPAAAITTRRGGRGAARIASRRSSAKHARRAPPTNTAVQTSATTGPGSGTSSCAHSGPSARATQPMKAAQRPPSHVSGSTGAFGIWASAPESIPSHIAGATAGRATRFAGIAVSETVPKWWAARGAVARVAARVIAAPSARARRTPVPSGARRRISGGARTSSPATAQNESCQPMSAVARGSIARVAAAARPSAYHLAVGLLASDATTPAMPITPARWIEAPAPATGT